MGVAKINHVAFLGSFPSYKASPKTGLPEFAFIGRSNVGKSSLINMLTGMKELARTSAKPGKTLLLNYFQCDNSFLLVDLPGYGFARISKTEKEKIQSLVHNYLLRSELLHCVFLLIDIRLPRQEADKAFMEWMAESGIPFVLVFTKADKLTVNQVKKSVEQYQLMMKDEWECVPDIFITSSTDRSGKEEILSFIGKHAGK